MATEQSNRNVIMSTNFFGVKMLATNKLILRTFQGLARVFRVGWLGISGSLIGKLL